MLGTTKEELKHSQYVLKEKEFIITEQRKAGSCVAIPYIFITFSEISSFSQPLKLS